jgi:hypothetical protein
MGQPVAGSGSDPPHEVNQVLEFPGFCPDPRKLAAPTPTTLVHGPFGGVMHSGPPGAINFVFLPGEQVTDDAT